MADYFTADYNSSGASNDYVPMTSFGPDSSGSSSSSGPVKYEKCTTCTGCGYYR